MHARYQSSGRLLVQNFQEHASTGRLGKALWQSGVRPAVDTNVGISTRLAFSISTADGATISGGASHREVLVWFDQAHLHFPLFTLLWFGTGNAFSSSQSGPLTPEDARLFAGYSGD
jgi:hypothetical protein